MDMPPRTFGIGPEISINQATPSAASILSAPCLFPELGVDPISELK
jgi:hypothetical protein